MKHAFSRMKEGIIRILAYVLCTLCKNSKVLTFSKDHGDHSDTITITFISSFNKIS